MPDLPKDAAERKALPIASGVLDYFPDALAEVARVSRVGNDQHNPGEPLHWAKEKSTDEADALVRHLMERGTIDTDGTRHSAKVAWRALALLQRELDAEALVARGITRAPYPRPLTPPDPFDQAANLHWRTATVEELERMPWPGAKPWRKGAYAGSPDTPRPYAEDDVELGGEG